MYLFLEPHVIERSEKDNIRMFFFTTQNMVSEDQNIFNASSPTFKLLESFWNRFQTILLNQEMNFKKNPIEFFWFFPVEKYFQKNRKKKLNFFLKLFFDRKKYFFRWDFFAKSFFSMMKKYFSMGFFFKFISWFRRIVWKRFLSDSYSLKVRKLVLKMFWSRQIPN